MKEGWEYKKLGEVCNIDFGTRVVRSRDAGSIYPVYGGGGATFKMDTYNREDCMVISRFGMSEQCTRFVKGRFFLNDSGLTLSIKKHCMIQNYMDWQILYLNNTIYSLGRGAAQKNLDTKALAEIIIAYPNNLSEQQSIVDYLDSAFAKIDAMKANSEKALNEAKALFQASLKEMLEPKEGWEEKTLKELTSKIGSGATPKGGRKVYIDKGCHLIRSMNVQYNEFKYDDLAHITDEAAEQLKGVEIQENDVLFNITGASIARCCVVPDDALPARVNQHVSILRLKQEVLPRFLSFIMNSPKHQRELLEIGEAGSTRQALTKTDLENHVICYPSLDNQNKLLATLDSLKSKVDRLQENFDKISQECDALKQAILKQVFE